ncbi:MAG: GNAT family N-acetyltransferase [Polyangiaceae bacterium]|nr:GNAT family N-acetyltransferase [Polyangiaceae bacterium]
MTDSMRVEVVELPRFDDLEERWRELEAVGDPSFFTGWDWIGCWLDNLPKSALPRLLVAESAGRTVGLGLLGRARVRRAKWISSRALHLNTVGDPYYDELTISHNGLLSTAGTERELWRRSIERLLKQNDWDEWVLAGMDSVEHLELTGLTSVHIVRLAQRPSYYVDLDAVRAGGRDYLGMLGPRTRYHVRRSIREYQALGPLHVEPAGSVAEAGVFMSELIRLHQAYWVDKGLPGSFANPFFRRFHAQLVERCFGKGIVQILKVRAGPNILGYLYSFVHRSRVLCYQCGFDYGLGVPHNRPGLVAHAKAVEFNLQLPHRVYDFLAGDARYKEELGTHSQEMHSVSLRRDRLRLRAADWLVSHKPAAARLRSRLRALAGRA